MNNVDVFNLFDKMIPEKGITRIIIDYLGNLLCIVNVEQKNIKIEYFYKNQIFTTVFDIFDVLNNNFESETTSGDWPKIFPIQIQYKFLNILQCCDYLADEKYINVMMCVLIDEINKNNWKIKLSHFECSDDLKNNHGIHRAKCLSSSFDNHINYCEFLRNKMCDGNFDIFVLYIEFETEKYKNIWEDQQKFLKIGKKEIMEIFIPCYYFNPNNNNME
jgi:hypothetical protein